MTHIFSSYEGDLFKKFKLKHYRMISHTYKPNNKATGIYHGQSINYISHRLRKKTHVYVSELFKRTNQKKAKFRFQRTVVSTVRYDPSNSSIDNQNFILNINSFHCFDKLSTLEILFDNLRLLFNHKVDRTKESIKKISCLLIDIFINWYNTLPFHSILNLDLNQLILNNQWSNYIILVLFYFLKSSFNQTDFISYEKTCERIFNYTQNYYLSSLTNRILNQLINFLSKFFDIHITNTEFTLLSILLILPSGNEIYLKMLYTYETHTFPSEQPFRYNRLFHLSEQIDFIAQILVKHQHFYLPFLLIPN